jgi:hypothetical protein
LTDKTYRQQGFCVRRAEVQNSTVVFQLNISNKTSFCASKSRPNAKPETLPATLTEIYKKFKDYEVTPEEKQSDLKKLRDILIATVEYYIDRYNSAKTDFGEFNPVEHYEKIKVDTEEHFRKGRLTRLKQYLRDMTEVPRETRDFNFGHYIKAKTGYEIDIFGVFQKRIDKIVDRKSIKTENEYRDVLEMVDSLCQSTPVDQIKIDTLNNLLIDFDDKISGNKIPKAKRKSKDKKQYFNKQLYSAFSPDNKRQLTITESGTDETYCSTQVFIQFEKSGAGVYAANGINLSIATYWKDNNTIVIETKKEYLTSQKWETIQDFRDILKVEYIET